jgi:hypothetical protein
VAAISTSMRRVFKALAVPLALSMVSLVAVFVAFIWWSSSGVFSTSKFDSSVWSAKQTNGTDITCYRGGMANDIKDRLLQRGMAMVEVEQLLGRPDIKSSAEYRYVLGMCSGFGLDYDDLHIYFENQGKLTRVAIIQH